MKSNGSIAVPRRKATDNRVQYSLRIPQRLLLYARDTLDIPRTVENALRLALTDMSIDLQVPHADEIMGTDESGKPMTFADAKKYGLYDARGRLVDDPSTTDGESEGAVL